MAYSCLTNLTTWWHSKNGQSQSSVHQLTARLQTPKSVGIFRQKHAKAFAAAAHHCRNGEQIRVRQHRCHSRHGRCQAQAAGNHASDVFDINSADTNQLQTTLNRAIAAEDYALASKIRDKLQAVVGSDTGTADWRHLGVPEWLADRVERMGFKYATGLPCIHETAAAFSCPINTACDTFMHARNAHFVHAENAGHCISGMLSFY